MKRFILFSMALIAMAITSCTAIEEDLDVVEQSDVGTRGSDIPLDSVPHYLLTEAENLGNALADETKTRGENGRSIKNVYRYVIDQPKTRDSRAEVASIYVINYEDEKGYAIMTDMETFPSLLAFVEEGNHKQENVYTNPGFATFMHNLDVMIANRDLQPFVPNDGEVPPGPGILSTTYEYKNYIYNQTATKVKWNQGNPYNKYCPLDNGERSFTGCTATAVAQFMACYKYPSSYSSNNFNWDSMTKYPNATYVSEEAQNQIATLMQQLGVVSNLHVTYSSDANIGSSAYLKNATRTLKNFGYSNGGKMSDYTNQILQDELLKGYPILMSGKSHMMYQPIFWFIFDVKYSGGHSWLIHGLLERRREMTITFTDGTSKTYPAESVWYPLCNWGWGGREDGYYLSDVFDTTKGPVYDEETEGTRSDTQEQDKDHYYRYLVRALHNIRK